MNESPKSMMELSDDAAKTIKTESEVFSRKPKSVIRALMSDTFRVHSRMKRSGREYDPAYGNNLTKLSSTRTHDEGSIPAFHGKPRQGGESNHSGTPIRDGSTNGFGDLGDFDIRQLYDSLNLSPTTIGRFLTFLDSTEKRIGSISQNMSDLGAENSTDSRTSDDRFQLGSNRSIQSTLVPPFSSSSTGSPRLNLSTPFLVACLSLGQPVALPPVAGELFFHLDKDVLKKYPSILDLQCSMTMTLPANKSLMFEFIDTHKAYHSPVRVYVSFTNNIGFILDAVIRPSWDRRAYSKPGSQLRVDLTVRKLTKCYNYDLFVRFNFTPIPESIVPGMETTFITPRVGYVQSAGFDGKTLHLLHQISAWVTVRMPRHVLTMISIPFFSLGLKTAALCLGGDVSLYTGFRLLFSFHDESSRLQIVAGGLWNCSVASWPEHILHFPCNLNFDCVDGQDEDMCPYNSRLCRPGYFLVSGTCYSYVSQKDTVTWITASTFCRMQSGHLVSLNRPEEWEAIVDVLMTYRRTTSVLIGLQTSMSNLPHIYRKTLQMADGSIAYYVEFTEYQITKPTCFSISVDVGAMNLASHPCQNTDSMDIFMCETEQRVEANEMKKAATISPVSIAVRDFGFVFNPKQFAACPRGHLTHTFLACDQRSACWVKELSTCSAPVTPLPPSFSCNHRVQQVPYNLVCDFRSDCSDNSDESFCAHHACSLILQFNCWNAQCVPVDKICDYVPDCVDGSDEMNCAPETWTTMKLVVKGPALVNFTKDRLAVLVPYGPELQTSNMSERCPANYYACDSISLCLPVYTRCNNVHDCPGREDEAACGTYTCPGLYRCRGSSVCVTYSEFCDGVYHCPLYDDELVCDLTCPPNCTCQGLTFFCRGLFQPGGLPYLRYLDASDSGLKPDAVTNNTLLIHLSLARCGLAEFGQLVLPNLHSLDLGDNVLAEVTEHHVSHLPNLKHLNLAGNPLITVFGFNHGKSVLTSISLQSLDLSRVIMTQFRMTDLRIFPTLEALNLSGCGVDTLQGSGSQAPGALRVLDVRGCPLTHFQPDLFQGLHALEEFSGDNYKLCCPQMLPPNFNLAHCRAPSDEVSSCQNLLRSDMYRVFLGLFACLALSGNVVVFVTRGVVGKARNGFEIFTIILCVSDFLMGIYLVIIGVADRLYKGSYLWNDDSWRHSAACSFAGFLSMVSNEVSAFIICLITLDRFLVLRFPLSRVRFSKTSGLVVSAMVWLVGVVLAAVPLLPPMAHWQFYSVNGICVPLPITRKDFPGHSYSFNLLVVFNFILFLLIALGQVFIFLSVQKNSLRFAGNSAVGSTKANSRNNDLTLASRLTVVAMTDFVCWFPIGLLGFLASRGISIPGEVNVAMAIFVLPLNSAINPFLYTINMLLETRRVKREQRLMNQLLAQVKQQAAMESQR